MLTFFVGLWPILWKMIASIGVGACLLIVAFVPISWIPMWVRKIALWAGALVLCFTFAYSVGLRDEHRRGVAQWNAAIDKEIHNAEKDRTASDADVDRSGDRGMSDDRYNRDNGAGRK